MQDAECKMQNEAVARKRCKMQNAAPYGLCKMKVESAPEGLNEMQDAECKMQNEAVAIRKERNQVPGRPDALFMSFAVGQ